MTTTSKFYITNRADPEAPAVLAECEGADGGTIRPGDRVVYENPAMRTADGTYYTAGMVQPLIVTEIIDFGGGSPVQVVLNDGKREVSGSNLRAEPGEGSCP